jgi:hypothetical protein
MCGTGLFASPVNAQPRGEGAEGQDAPHQIASREEPSEGRAERGAEGGAERGASSVEATAATATAIHPTVRDAPESGAASRLGEDRAVDAPGDDGDEEEGDRSGWAAFPFATYAPETHVGLGAFGIYYFRLPSERTSSRPSSVAVDGLGTTRGQVIAEIIPEFYWDEERFNLWTKADFRAYPDTFWGIGPNTPDTPESYSTLSFRGRGWLRRQFWESLSGGVRLDGQYLEVTKTELNGIFDRETILGEEGGFTLGLGLTLDWDTRDNAVEARDGAYYQAQLMTWQRWWGSEYAFTRLSVDLRQFFELYEGHALGLQLYSEFNFGNVPFYQMARLGGPNQMRGFFEGRFTDRVMLTSQIEYRFPIFWRFRGVVFASAGDVSDRIDRFDFGSLEVAGGGGLRFAIDTVERLNLRLDFGFTPKSWGAYVFVAEAF